MLIFMSIVVPGHEGKLIFSTLGERQVPVVLLVGRAQYVDLIYTHTQCTNTPISSPLTFAHIFFLFYIVSTKATAWKP